jgi:hypothetical protein
MSALAVKEAVEGFFKGTVKPVLDKFIPDAEKRLEAENMIFTQVHAIGMGQIEINKEEAKSSKLFVAGWRPAVGWICAFNLGYAMLGNDILNWCLQMASVISGKSIPMLPEPDITLTLELLLGLLGLGGLRTYEKLKGVHAK